MQKFSLLRLITVLFALCCLIAPQGASAAGSAARAKAAKPRATGAKTRSTTAKARDAAASDQSEATQAIEPEEVSLAEDAPPEPKEKPKADTETPPANDHPAPARAGPSAHVSLESSGYTDTEHVNVVSPTVAFGLTDDVAGWSVNGHYLVDVVSAASVDIVSTASPHWTEVRHVGSLSGSVAFDPVTVGALGVISREPDYLSVTGGVTLGIDLAEKNVTPYFAFSREADSVGRTDLPHEFWKSKHVTNLQLGVTLVLGRSTIGSVQWDGSFERGYLAKPYRYVPLFAPGQGGSIPAGASIDDVNRLRLNLRPSEQVPNARDRYAVSGHLAHRVGDSATLRVDERFYADNWGLLASTSELRYIMDVARRLELWPHFRYHFQNEVRFWQRAYEAVPGPSGVLGVPVFRAGDRELSPLQTIVLGAGARLKLALPPGNQWDLVVEIDIGRTHFSDALYLVERRMAYSTLAIEATF